MSEIRISLASPMLALHGGWEAGMMNNHTPIMDNLTPHTVSSRKRVRSNDSDDERNYDADVDDQNQPDWNLVWPRFIVLDSVNPSEPLSKLSPFAVEKAIKGRFGTVKKVTKMRSGSLLIEASRPTQAKMILDTTVLIDTEVKATPHRSLNTSKGVIRDYGRDLFTMSESEIVKEMTDQGVENVSRFILKKDGKEIKTNTYFITFSMSTPPEKLRIGYYFVEVKRYIPNPLRCFQCQEFGHSRKFCKKQLKCRKCGCEGHDGSDCHSETLCCVNCKGEHFSSSKSCPVWTLEKEIQRVKTEKSLPYGEARRFVTASSSSSSAPTSYANAVRVTSTPKRSVECQTPDFWMPDNTPLSQLIKKPSVVTKSASTGTERQPSPVSSKKSHVNENKNVNENKKATPIIKQNKPPSLQTGNKYQSLSSDVDEDMDDSPSPSRPSRSRSRSRQKNGHISPVKYK